MCVCTCVCLFLFVCVSFCSIASYIPASILTYLINTERDPNAQIELPIRDTYESVVLFADVSGFTAMCEALSAKGNGGDEALAQTLNSYFELLVRIMSSQGGDVFKYAGDALIVLWPPSEETLQVKARRAAQCALDINDLLQEAVMADGVSLSVKIGLGVGELTILHIGGVYNRLEYLAIGDPLAQAFHAEHSAAKKEVVASPQTWKMISEFFDSVPAPDGEHVFLTAVKPKTLIRKKNIHQGTDKKSVPISVWDKAGYYVPPAIIPFVAHGEDRLMNELRRVVVLFVNLGVPEAELVKLSSPSATLDDIKRIHIVIATVQHAIYRFEGSLNKFLMDDKGATLIAIFGQPPLAHDNDSVRAVLAALAIQDSLYDLGLRVSIGITTGPAFCGVCGTKGRREYTVLGDTVNLSARLMQKATVSGAGVLVDDPTLAACKAQESVWYDLNFFRIDKIMVKGKSMPIVINQPHLEGRQKDFSMKTLKDKLTRESVLEFDDQHNLVLEEKGLVSYRATMIEDLTNLVNKKQPKFQVIMGDAGIGKSYFVLSFLEHAKMTFSSSLQFIIVAANPFDTLRAKYDVFKQLLLYYLKERKDDNRMVVRSLLVEESGPGGDSMAPCLNEIIEDIRFEETKVTCAMSKEARSDACQELFMTLITAISRIRPLIFVIEDGHYTDDASWVLLQSLHQAINLKRINLYLLIVTRPMNISNFVAFYKGTVACFLVRLELLLLLLFLLGVPAGWAAIENFVDIIKLQPLPNNSMIKLATLLLNADKGQKNAATQERNATVTPTSSFGDLLLKKSSGNPLVLVSFIRAIQDANLVMYIYPNCGRGDYSLLICHVL
jgi:class 3 adenylate cyclase